MSEKTSASAHPYHARSSKGDSVMKAIDLAHSRRFRGAFRTTGLVLLAMVVLAPPVFAQRFQLRQSLTTDSNNATSTKRRDAPPQVSGKLEASGVGLFVSGNAEETVTVKLTGEFEGTPDKMKGRNTQTITFGDGSTLKITFDASSQGRRFTGSITGGEGSGRFQNAKITGSVTGNAVDPTLNYMEISGNIDKR
jgi:hypothetical protein